LSLFGGQDVVAVTGANGFVGRHLVESLAAGGSRVTAMTRRPSAQPSGVVEAIVPDLLDRAAVRRALDGANSVVHLAARVHAMPEGKGDPSSECRRVNVEGTAMLLEESAAAGVRKFVFISSVKAVANESVNALTPDTPPQPGDVYGESKLEAERLVKVVGLREGIGTRILRLPVVYGPGMKANMAMLFSAVSRGFPLPLASVKNRRSFAYVGNVVEAIRLLLSADGDAPDPFYVSDDHDLSTPELIELIGASLGRPARLFPMPEFLLRGAGQTGGLLSRIAGLHLSSDSVTAVLGSLFVDTSSLREMTGYAPPISVEQGLSKTADWFRSRRAGATR
jgi:nucleoside-diphosphate-sugar epimerase